MQTYGTSYNTQNDPALYGAFSNGRERTAEGKGTRDAAGFEPGVPLELWDCEHGSLSIGETRLFRVRFTRGQSIRLRVWAKDGIGISVQDIYGHTIAQESRQDGRSNCSILPRRSGEYLVTLVNTVDHEAHYVLYIADETRMMV